MASTSFLPSFGEITSSLFCLGNSKQNLDANKNIERIRTLPKEFYETLVKLESDFHRNKYTVETLDELVQQYTKAVEFYDNVQDEIAGYFSFKIQDILTARKSLQIMGVGKDSDIASGSTSAGLSHYNKNKVPFSADQHDDLSSDDEKEKVRKVEWEKKKKERESQKPKKSLEKLKGEKQRHANFFYNVEAEKAKKKGELEDMFDKHNNSAHDIEKNVASGINKQKERLRQKLEHKRSASFHAYALDCSMNSSFGKDFAKDLAQPINKNNKLLDELNDSYMSNGSNPFLDDDIDAKNENILNDLPNEPVASSRGQLSNIPQKKSIFRRQGTVTKENEEKSQDELSPEAITSSAVEVEEKAEAKPQITRGGSRKFTL